MSAGKAPGKNPSEIGVLVADDDPNSRDSLATLLAREGFRTSTAPGGQAALELLCRQFEVPTPSSTELQSSTRNEPVQQRVHFLVLDYNMPDLTGLELLEKVNFELELTLPTILVSGQSGNELERAVLAAGGFGLLPKPVQPPAFRDLVWQLVKNCL